MVISISGLILTLHEYRYTLDRFERRFTGWHPCKKWGENHLRNKSPPFFIIIEIYLGEFLIKKDGLLKMTLSIDIKNNIIPIDKERLVTIFPATEEDYWVLSNEDLKVEFARGRIYIHSPASLAHEELVISYYVISDDIQKTIQGFE